MPLVKKCSKDAVQANYSRLYKEGYRNPQLSAIVLNTLKRACGVKGADDMTADEIIASSGQTESQQWSRKRSEFQKRQKEKEKKSIGSKLKKGFKMVFGIPKKVDSTPVPHQKRKPMSKQEKVRKMATREGRWVPLDVLFEDLPSSPVVRGLAFSLPGGMRGVGSSYSAAPPNKSRGLVGNNEPPIPMTKCEKCGKIYGSSRKSCPECGKQ